jgi:hypothetical protein
MSVRSRTTANGAVWKEHGAGNAKSGIELSAESDRQGTFRLTCCRSRSTSNGRLETKNAEETSDGAKTRGRERPRRRRRKQDRRAGVGTYDQRSRDLGQNRWYFNLMSQETRHESTGVGRSHNPGGRIARFKLSSPSTSKRGFGIWMGTGVPGIVLDGPLWAWLEEDIPALN